MPYKYTEEIEKQLAGFEKYLRSKRYAPDTIRQNRNYAGIYLEWLEAMAVTADQAEYRELADFILHLKANEPINRIRRIILAVRHYYDSLDIDKNPASGIYIRGYRKSILPDIVPYRELTGLYHSFQTLDDRSMRNKVILGLIIFQAVTTAELHRLEPGHIQLKTGRIYIPGHSTMNSRTLHLEAAQMLELQEYLMVVRPRMLSRITQPENMPEASPYRSGRKPSKINPLIYDRLFFSENGSDNIKNSLYQLFRSIKRTHPKIRSAKTIRSTAIAEWLKTQDVRIVQYMAGHRWVSSTERYNVYRLKELKDSLEQHHPLK